MRLTGDSAQEAHYRELVDAVELPQPFSLGGLVAAVAHQRGCDITLEPLPAGIGPEVSGLVARTATGFVMQIPFDAEPWWAWTPVCHELAHVICGHVSGEDPTVSRPAAALRSRLPVIRDAEEAWGPLFRCDLSADTEQEAEFVASLLVGRIERLPASPPIVLPGRDGDILGRFARVLGSRRDRRR